MIKPLNTNPEVKHYLGLLQPLNPNNNGSVSGLGSLIIVDANQYQHILLIEASSFQHLQEQVRSLSIRPNEWIYLFASVRDHTVINWQVIKSPLLLAEINLLLQISYSKKSFLSLMDLVDSVNNPYLHGFIIGILKDQELMKKWLANPASNSHHHNFPGGLIIHSLQCAQLVKMNLGWIESMSENEKELTVIATLLHDIGKLLTHEGQKLSTLGYMVHHEQLSLMILSRHLEKLTQSWKYAAETIIYLLTWTPKQGFCRFLGGNFIQLADYISTSFDLREQAFLDKPQQHHFALYQTYTGSKHTVRRLP